MMIILVDMMTVFFIAVVYEREDELSLLEKLAKFSMSSGTGCLKDFDPVTGALSNRAAFHADSQTETSYTARGNALIDCSSLDD